MKKILFKLFVLFGSFVFFFTSVKAGCLDKQSFNSMEMLFPASVKYDLTDFSNMARCKTVGANGSFVVCGYLSESNPNFMVIVFEENSISSGSGEFILSEGNAIGIRVEPIDVEQKDGIESVFAEEVRKLNRLGVITVGSDLKLDELFEKIKIGDAGYNYRYLFIGEEWKKYDSLGLKLLSKETCGTNGQSDLFMNEEGEIYLMALRNIDTSTDETTKSTDDETASSSSDDKDKEESNSPIGFIIITVLVLAGLGGGGYYFFKVRGSSKIDKDQDLPKPPTDFTNFNPPQNLG